MTDGRMPRQLLELEANIGQLLEAHAGREAVDLRKWRGPLTVGLVCAFAMERCRLVLTGQQQQIVELYVRGGWAAVRSAVGIGKTTVCAVLLVFHVYARGGRVVSLAASDRQIKQLLWGEVRRLWSGSGLPGDLYQQALVIDGVTRAIGFVTTDESKLRGWHDRKLLVLVDESQGVAPWVWDSVAALCTGEENQVLAIGNPGPCVGAWYNIHQNPRWARLALSSLDHPNIVEGREIIPGGPSRGWVEHLRREYGDESAYFRSVVLGEFSETVGEGLIERSWIDAAVARWQSGALEAEALAGEYVASLDVARFGSDANVLMLRRGPVVREIATWKKCDLMETVDRMVAALAGWAVRIWPYQPPVLGCIPANEMGRYVPPNPANTELARFGRLPTCTLTIDAVGMGAGVYDACNRRGFYVREFIASHAAAVTESHKFLNRRSEAAFGLMRKFQDGRIAIPPHEQLIEELMGQTWFQNPSGKIQLVSKDETRLLLGRSPDFFDALMMLMDESHRGVSFEPVRVRMG